MYSRSYQTGEIPTVPESYSGVAFREPDPIPEDVVRSVAKSADVKFTTPAPPDPNLTTSAEPEPEPEAVETGGFLSEVVSNFPLKGIFSGISAFKPERLGLSKIGTEEILIFGLALFLFFSREGDKECSLLLILLLFIH